MRILIVEDEYRMARAIQSLLKQEGFSSDIATDGEKGLDCIMSDIYDLVILDVMLPTMDGFQILETVRARGIQVPVLLLTARSSVTDRVEGLNKGADYYLPKPFSTDELVACIHALLRRPREMESNTIGFGDLSLDMESGNLECGENSIHLNKRELELFSILMKGNGVPVTREALLAKVWGIEASPESNVLDAYMSFLRKKLTFIHSQTVITNRRRIGYYLHMQDKMP